jgi:hypothetical protein
MMNDEVNPDILVIENLMRTEEGRAFVMRHLTFAKVFSDTFDKDPIQHALNAGMRKAGLQLDREIKEADPSGYMKMIKESIDG